MNFIIKSWNQLSKEEFHDIIQLRETIFAVEQKCCYLDVDGKDIKSHHLFLTVENKIVAYCRIIPIGISYSDSASIGRFLVHKNFRKNGIARKMMLKAINKCNELFKSDKIIISGQAYLKSFYESIGFKTIGEIYLEDNIPHYKMIFFN